MADNIDKALPNEVRKEINIPSPEEIQVELEKDTPEQPIDIQPNEDGSVDVNFDPSAANQEQGNDHFANLAELLPDEVLHTMAVSYMITTKIIKILEKIGKLLIQKV